MVSLYSANAAYNNAMVREANRKRVVDLLLQNDVMTKRDIARKLDLSSPTVYQIADELVADGLAAEGETLQSTGGRKPVALSIVPEARVSVGVRLSQHHLRMVLLDLRGRMLNSHVYQIVFSDTPFYWENFAFMLEDFLDQSGADRKKLLGVGVAFPGTISPDFSMVEFSSTMNIRHMSLDAVRFATPYPIWPVSSANAAGCAEMWANWRFTHVFYLSISEGIGGAIFINNELYAGFNNRSAEVGHTIIDVDGPPCKCGRRGCFETFCSTLRLTEPFGETLEQFFEALEKGDKQRAEVWTRYMKYLVVGLNNLRLLFDMKIIIGGELSRYMPRHMDQLLGMIKEENVFSDGNIFTHVAHYDRDVDAVGAALQCVMRFLSDGGKSGEG